MKVSIIDRFPEMGKKADQYIPNVFGSARVAWIMGYLGHPKGRWWEKTSACEKFYELGKKSKKEGK